MTGPCGVKPWREIREIFHHRWKFRNRDNNPHAEHLGHLEDFEDGHNGVGVDQFGDGHNGVGVDQF